MRLALDDTVSTDELIADVILAVADELDRAAAMVDADERRREERDLAEQTRMVAGLLRTLVERWYRLPGAETP